MYIYEIFHRSFERDRDTLGDTSRQMLRSILERNVCVCVCVESSLRWALRRATGLDLAIKLSRATSHHELLREGLELIKFRVDETGWRTPNFAGASLLDNAAD